jgi:transposase
LIEQRGCELVYLPSYSPDFNPIEEAFAKIKNLSFARLQPGPKKRW